MLEGAIKGVLGGIVALILCRMAFLAFRAGVAGQLQDLRFFDTSHMTLILLFGTLIGLVGSLLSVGRHLRRV